MFLTLAGSAVMVGCVGRTAGDETGETETGEPLEPGEPLTACADEDDCFVEWCVHPAGEPGFCTFECESEAVCPSGPSGTATPTCLLVGADQVCALDCDGRSCPAAMRCEKIESGGDARSICF